MFHKILGNLRLQIAARETKTVDESADTLPIPVVELEKEDAGSLDSLRLPKST